MNMRIEPFPTATPVRVLGMTIAEAETQADILDAEALIWEARAERDNCVDCQSYADTSRREAGRIRDAIDFATCCLCVAA